MRVDLKSVLLGSGLILALFIIAGQSPKTPNSVGRFQILMPSGSSTFSGQSPILLDTQTGTTYVKNQERWFWEIVPRCQTVLGGDLYVYYFKHMGVSDSTIFSYIADDSSPLSLDSLRSTVVKEFEWGKF